MSWYFFCFCNLVIYVLWTLPWLWKWATCPNGPAFEFVLSPRRVFGQVLFTTWPWWDGENRFPIHKRAGRRNGGWTPLRNVAPPRFKNRETRPKLRWESSGHFTEWQILKCSEKAFDDQVAFTMNVALFKRSNDNSRLLNLKNETILVYFVLMIVSQLERSTTNPTVK